MRDSEAYDTFKLQGKEVSNKGIQEESKTDQVSSNHLNEGFLCNIYY